MRCCRLTKFYIEKQKTPLSTGILIYSLQFFINIFKVLAETQRFELWEDFSSYALQAHAFDRSATFPSSKSTSELYHKKNKKEF